MIVIDIIASFIISTLAGMGVGGGGLLVIYLTLLRSVEQFMAQGINLLFFICAAAAAIFVNFKKQALDFRTVVILSVSGTVFAVIGAILASYVNVYILRKIFGVLLIVSGIVSIFHKDNTFKK